MFKKMHVYLLFVLIIASSVLNMYFADDSNFSKRENRELAKVPTFSVKKLVTGKYFKQLDYYFGDHFMFRDELVDMSSKIKTGVSKYGIRNFVRDDKAEDISVIKFERDENAVIKYRDGVFFVFDANKAQINRYTKAVNFVSYNLENVDVSVMLVPTAIEFVDDAPKIFGVTSQRTMIDRAKETLNGNIKFVDVYDILNRCKDEYIYFKSDHHWTPLGAYYGYFEFAAANGLFPTDCRLENAGEFCGSFADFTNSPEVEEITDMMSTQKIVAQYWCHGAKSKASESVQMRDMYPESFDGYKRILGGDTGYIRVETMNKTDRRLLIVKDSYANALVPYFTEHYNRIIMVDPRYYKDNLYETIKSEKITDVLFVNNTETISDDAYIEKLEDMAGKTGYLER